MLAAARALDVSLTFLLEGQCSHDCECKWDSCMSGCHRLSAISCGSPLSFLVPSLRVMQVPPWCSPRHDEHLHAHAQAAVLKAMGSPPKDYGCCFFCRFTPYLSINPEVCEWTAYTYAHVCVSMHMFLFLTMEKHRQTARSESALHALQADPDPGKRDLEEHMEVSCACMCVHVGIWP